MASIYQTNQKSSPTLSAHRFRKQKPKQNLTLRDTINMPKTQFSEQSNPELFITSNDLIAILDEIKSSNHELNKKQFQLALNLIQSRKNGKFSPENAYRLYKIFKKIKKENINYLQSKQIQLLNIICKTLYLSWATQAKQSNFERNYLDNIEYKKPGSLKSKSFTAGLGTGLSLIPFFINKLRIGPSVDINIEGHKERKFFTDEEGMYYDHRVRKVRVSGGGRFAANPLPGFNLGVGTKITADATHINYREYDNLEDFLHRSGGSIKKPQSGKLKTLKSLFSSRVTHKKIDQAHQKLLNSKHQFETLKKELNLIQIKLELPELKIEEAFHGVVRGKSASAELSVDAGISELNLAPHIRASGTGLVANEKIHLNHPTSFFDCIQNHEDVIPSIPQYLISDLRLLLQNQTKEKCLAQIDEDLKSYTDIVQAYDHAKKIKSRRSINRLRQSKHAIENKYNTLGRHHLLQKLNAWNAYIYSQAKHNQNIHKICTRLANHLKYPQIKHDRGKLLYLTSFVREIHLNILRKQATIQLNTPFFNGKVTIHHDDFMHPSRIRDGKYIEINVSGEFNFSFTNIVDANAYLNEAIHSAATQQGMPLPEGFSLGPNLNLTGDKTFTVKWFKPRYSEKKGYQGYTGWRKLFTRTSSSTNINPHLSLGAAVAPSVHLSGKVAFSKFHKFVDSEHFDPNDIIYPMMIFNRFYLNHKNDKNNEEWKQYFLINEEIFQAMFLEIAQTNTMIHNEVRLGFQELISREKNQEQKNKYKKQENEFFHAMRCFSSTQNAHTQAEAEAQLNSYFEAMITPWLTDHLGRWGNFQFKGNKNSALSFKTILSKKLGTHVRFKHQ